MEKFMGKRNWKSHGQSCFVLLPFLLVFIIISISFSSLHNNRLNFFPRYRNFQFAVDECSGKYIYVYNDLPSEFNIDFIKNCGSLLIGTDMCSYLKNAGLGPAISTNNTSWYATNQFSLEVIFHNRIKGYKCLTNDSSMASAIFVPYYAGLDVGRYLWGYNVTVRDERPLKLVKWLSEKTEWKKMWGRDHFLIGGRISWDFRRKTDNDSDWGTKLMFLPESRNMTLLSIEAGVWSNECAIPYPTYFHPARDSEVFEWQKRLKTRKRPHLFTFVGAPRPNMEGSIRGHLIEQCQEPNSSCKLLDCRLKNCENPMTVMRAFERSVFCLQPSGDSFTRRSTFDSILAGCVPVFFHPSSAYRQYLWHLPQNYSKYSVFIRGSDVKEGNVKIKDRLLRYSEEDIVKMRNEVIRLIPKVVYADPNAKLDNLEDAFDIAINGIIQRVEGVRRKIEQGMDPSLGFAVETDSLWHGGR